MASKRTSTKRYTALAPAPTASRKLVSPVIRSTSSDAAASAEATPVAAPAAITAPATPAAVVAPTEAPATTVTTEATVTEATVAADAPAAAVTPEPAVTPSADPAEVAELIRALQDSSAEYARDAAAALGRLKAVEPLIEVLYNNDGYFHCVVRAAAAEGLGQIGDAKAVDALLYAVRDPMAEASAEAVRALAQIGDARAVEPLLDVFANPGGFYLQVVRLAVVHALARFRSPASVQKLLDIAADEDEDLVIRDAARAALV